MNNERNGDGWRDRMVSLARAREAARAFNRLAWRTPEARRALAKRARAAQLASIRQARSTKPDNTGNV